MLKSRRSALFLIGKLSQFVEALGDCRVFRPVSARVSWWRRQGAPPARHRFEDIRGALIDSHRQDRRRNGPLAGTRAHSRSSIPVSLRWSRGHTIRPPPR